MPPTPWEARPNPRLTSGHGGLSVRAEEPCPLESQRGPICAAARLTWSTSFLWEKSGQLGPLYGLWRLARSSPRGWPPRRSSLAGPSDEDQASSCPSGLAGQCHCCHHLHLQNLAFESLFPFTPMPTQPREGAGKQSLKPQGAPGRLWQQVACSAQPGLDLLAVQLTPAPAQQAQPKPARPNRHSGRVP